MRGGGRYCGGEDPSHLCPGLQCPPYSQPAPHHAHSDGVGHRPVSDLQGDSTHSFEKCCGCDLWDGVSETIGTGGCTCKLFNLQARSKHHYETFLSLFFCNSDMKSVSSNAFERFHINMIGQV
ncbi:hypothetical protein AVEN_48349-1 [Araneus ventricosus]|uniref:Uncharacterized protein n=1 Tax=Araneus ventricosus TaxID=182803 RepID=A0A4Y2MNE1_ARAVE|nr:hypothetical protein AVEN_48349-1 [Araneus ventricosus]